MTTETTMGKRVLCPVCRQKGRRVSPVTLRALLKDECQHPTSQLDTSCRDTQGTSGEGCTAITDDTGWRFCNSQDCDVVYFAEQDEATYTKSQLRVAVGVKETTGERPLCYCFGHSVASIKEDLRAIGKATALEDIRAKMKDPGCRCETENPSGSCCLGSVEKGIQTAQSELVASDSSGPTAAQDEPAAARSSPVRNRGELIAKVGTIISAVVASACCWLPLVLLAVGVSGAGIASTLEVYRPMFIAMTFGFLGAAFYFTYRPKKKIAAGAGHDCCTVEPADGDNCCALTGNRRLSMMTLNKVMLWVVTVLAVAFLFFPSYVGLVFGTRNETAVTEDMNRAVFKIDGMTCEGCATTVAQAIRRVNGVMAVDIEYEKRQAVVGTDPCCPVPKEKIQAALNKAGYSGTPLGEGDTKKTVTDASDDSAPTTRSGEIPLHNGETQNGKTF